MASIDEGRALKQELVKICRWAKNEMVKEGEALKHNLDVEIGNHIEQKFACATFSMSENREQVLQMETHMILLEREMTALSENLARVEKESTKRLGAVVRTFDLAQSGQKALKTFASMQRGLTTRCRSLSTEHFSERGPRGKSNEAMFEIGRSHVRDCMIASEKRPDVLARPHSAIPESFRESRRSAVAESPFAPPQSSTYSRCGSRPPRGGV